MVDTQKVQKYDIVIIGAGPAGLCFARALAGTDLKIAVLERHKEEVLANPPRDGRDIALTHFSEKVMKELGLWDLLPANGMSPIKEARVLDGTSPYFMQFHHQETGKDMLGYLVSNHLIRKAAYESVQNDENIEILTEIEVKDVATSADRGVVTLANGDIFEAQLVIAADSRFSQARRQVGISASMKDFGRTVIVCNMTHEKPHEEIAYECFHYDQTLAVLPLNDQKSSIVITLPSDQADHVVNMDADEFARDITERFEHRHGDMKLIGKRYPYPLVAVYADKFVTTRLALVGDAAVGMHPVTAHGFNLGLKGADTLAKEIIKAQENGLDIGSGTVLNAYQTQHRKVTKPLYMGTNALVALYTKETPPAKFLRRALLRAGNNIGPVKRMITNQLTEIKKNSA